MTVFFGIGYAAVFREVMRSGRRRRLPALRPPAAPFLDDDA